MRNQSDPPVEPFPCRPLPPGLLVTMGRHLTSLPTRVTLSPTPVMPYRNSSDSELKLAPGPKRINLRDIAEAMDVAVMTVSRALRNEPGVSQTLREQIQEKAREMGYEPDPALAALQYYRRTKTAPPITSTIAWLNAWPDPKSLRSIPDFDLYWKGAQEMAESFGYRLEEFDIGANCPPKRVQSILHTRNIQAILIPPHSFIEVDWSGFDWNQFSVVRFGSGVKLEIHSVTSDQVGNSIMAIEKIRELGYKRIGFVGPYSHDRLFGAGFLWAQAKLPQTECLPPYLFEGNFEQGKPAFFDWLKSAKPDAIYGEVRSVIQSLKSEGYNIPEDIGVATTSILDIDADNTAGVDQHPEEIGRVAVQTLVALFHEHSRGLPSLPRQVLVKGQWVDGPTLPKRT